MCVLHHFRDQTQHPPHDQTMHHKTQYLAPQDEASALHGYHSNGRGTASFNQIDPRTLQAHTNLFEGHLLLVGLSRLPSELVDQPAAEQRAVGGRDGARTQTLLPTRHRISLEEVYSVLHRFFELAGREGLLDHSLHPRARLLLPTWVVLGLDLEGRTRRRTQEMRGSSGAHFPPITHQHVQTQVYRQSLGVTFSWASAENPYPFGLSAIASQ